MLCPLVQSRVMLFYFGVLDFVICDFNFIFFKILRELTEIRDTTWRDMILQESREVNDQASGIPSLRQFSVILIEGPDILGQQRWVIPNEICSNLIYKQRNNWFCLKILKLNICKRWLIYGLWDGILLSCSHCYSHPHYLFPSFREEKPRGRKILPWLKACSLTPDLVGFN